MTTMARMAAGAVAVIECTQNIPCNPCADACPRGAIKPMADINECPVLDVGRCNGCGLCLARCPGLAIFVVDCSYAPDKALIKLPYEFLPLPAVGETVEALDRNGRCVGTVEVVKIQEFQNKTRVVWIAVPLALAAEVRNIRCAEATMDEAVIVCRCEDVTLAEVRRLIAAGAATTEEIKRACRCGMGPCQGRTCQPLVAGELARATGKQLGEVALPTSRPPAAPVSLGALARGGRHG